MPAPSKNFTVLADTAVDVDSPIDQYLMTALRDNTMHLEEWLGMSYTAAQDHDHDGANSKAVTLLATAGAAVKLLATYNASASPSIPVTGLDFTPYDTILVLGRGIIPVNNGAILRCRVGTGGGPTWETGAVYDIAANGYTSAGAASNLSLASATYMDLTSAVGYITSSSGPGDCNFNLRLNHPNNTAVYKSCDFEVSYNNNVANDLYRHSGAGRWRGTTAVTAIQFYFDSGNIQAGAFDVYGFKKS